MLNKPLTVQIPHFLSISLPLKLHSHISLTVNELKEKIEFLQIKADKVRAKYEHDERLINLQK